MRRCLYTAALFLLASPALAGAAETKARAYDLLQTSSGKHEMGDAYLLGYASYFIYPDFLTPRKRTDHKEFTEGFGSKFEPLGFRKDDIRFVAHLPSGTEAAVMSNDRAVVVVFRGSESADKCAFVKDWLTNLNACQLAVPELGKGVKVHKGVWKALDGVYEPLVKLILQQGGFTKKRVYVTGHSLGGALATMCGVRLLADGKGKAVLYTFGAPRIGNPEFKRLSHELTIHRWVNGNDIVPMLPSDRLLNYRHVGLAHHITKKGELRLDSEEFRGKGSTAAHHINRYLEAIREALPEKLKGLMPPLPG